MRIEVGKPSVPRPGQVLIKIPDYSGAYTLVLNTVVSLDTDEKWLEVYYPRKGPTVRHSEASLENCTVLANNGNLVKCKLYIDYDVVDRNTGEVFYSVRQ